MTYSLFFQLLCLGMVGTALSFNGSPFLSRGGGSSVESRLFGSSDSYSVAVSSVRQILTPGGRRGKGKTVLGLTYAPPIPVAMTDMLLISSTLPKCSEQLRERASCKYIVVPGGAIAREEGWEVDLKPFLEEQRESAPPGSVPGAVQVFVDFTGDCDVSSLSQKLPELKKAGLRGVVFGEVHTALIQDAVEMGLVVIYKLGKDFDFEKGMDFTGEVAGLPEVSGLGPEAYLGGVILPERDQSFYDEEAGKDSDRLLPLPPSPYNAIPVISTSGVPAGDGKLQVAAKRLMSCGYSSICKSARETSAAPARCMCAPQKRPFRSLNLLSTYPHNRAHNHRDRNHRDRKHEQLCLPITKLSQ